MAKHNIAQSSVFCVHIKPAAGIWTRGNDHTRPKAQGGVGAEIIGAVPAVHVLLVYRFDGGCARDISDIKMSSMEIEGLFSFNVKMDHYVQ